MSRHEEPLSQRASSPDRTVDARQLWSGGAATAVVAALIALVGILVCRWLFNIPLLAPRHDGAWGDASTAEYAITAAAAALAATAVMHLLLAATPRPLVFFNWIMGLATVIAVMYPFSTTAALSLPVIGTVRAAARSSLVVSASPAGEPVLPRRDLSPYSGGARGQSVGAGPPKEVRAWRSRFLTAGKVSQFRRR